MPCLGDDVVAIVRVDGPVGIAMEDDRRHCRYFTPRPIGSAPTHGGQGRRYVLCRAAGEPRMDADSSENIRIGDRHDRRRCAASRETRHIDSSWIGRELLDDLPGDASDEGWLAALALLVTGVEPVPAFLHVCRLGLTRIGDQE